MPDYPYVYDARPSPPIGSGGTRLRIFRRRAPQGGQEEPEGQDGGSPEDRDARWRELLRQAVEDLNTSFRSSAVPFSCVLEEDDNGYCLRVSRTTDADASRFGQPFEAVEEIVEPGDLPLWLTRLRSRLGILVDEEV